MSCVIVFQALEAKVGHSNGAVGCAKAAAYVAVIWRARWVVHIVPFVNHHGLLDGGRTAGTSWNSFFLVAVLFVLMHVLSWVEANKRIINNEIFECVILQLGF